MTVEERAILAALDDQFVSASVVRLRARLSLSRTAGENASGTALSDRTPIGLTLGICRELERRGLVERVKVAGVERWRRA